MPKFSSILKYFVVIFFCWVVVCLAFGKYDSPSDGSDEIGFPFTFYREFTGKCFDCEPKGFFTGQFILDILIVFVFSFIVRLLVYRIKALK